jgi:hypothetical protein
MKKMVYMISDTCWGNSMLVDEGVFMNENDAKARAKEIAEADAKDCNGHVEEKIDKYSGETEYWVYWKTCSHCFRVAKLEAR